MPKYLVTGGCGFIGSHLVQSLLNQGFEVRVLDDLSTGDLSKIPSKVQFIKGCITDQIVVSEVLDGVDGCFHLAAVASVNRSIEEWSATSKVNLLGTINLLEAISQREKTIPFIYASSAAVYGSSPTSPIAETYPLNPISPYGVDKWASEVHIKLAWELHAIPSVGFRFFNVYGEGQDSTSAYSGVISVFLDRFLNNQPLTVFGDGRQLRDYIYVKDVVAFLEKALFTPFEGSHIFNLCTGKGTTVLQLIEIFSEIFQKNVPVLYKPCRKGDIRTSLGDPRKLEQFYSLKAKTSLREGLDRLVQSCV